MTVQNPALYLQGANHPAEDFRHLISSIAGDQPGVFGTGDLAVTEKSGTANMSVDISEGTVLVAGDEATYQGLYLCHNRGVTNLAIAASDPTNDRYDLIVAQVEDSDYSGATDAWKLAVVTGTAAATPLFPTVPDNSFVLATVLVQNAVSTIVDADITDIRAGSDTDGTTTLTNYGLAPSPGTIRCLSTARPQSPFEGMKIYESDTNREWTYNGSLWIPKSSVCRVSLNSDQVITNNVGATIDWDVEELDLDGMYNNGTSASRINMLWPGIYHVSWTVRWAASTAGDRSAYILESGGVRALNRNASTAFATQMYQTVATTLYTTGTSGFIEAQVLQSSGGNLNVEGVGSFDPVMTVTFQSMI